MRLAASDFYSFYRPSRCELRVYLKAKSQREAAAGPYREVLKRLGARHERAHLATFPEVIDLSAQPEATRVASTVAEVQAGAAVL